MTRSAAALFSPLGFALGLLLLGALGCAFPLRATARTLAVTSGKAPRPRAASRAPENDALDFAGTPSANRLPTPVLDVTAVTAGKHVLVRWPSLAGAAQELELVFSLDDGSHFDLRVSPQLSGNECRYVWRVPNIGVRNARLALRARIDGRELSGPQSAPLQIVPNPMRGPGLWVYRAGEWWEDRAGVPFNMPGLLTPPRSPILQSDASPASLAVTVRAPDMSSPSRASGPAFVGFTAPRTQTPGSDAISQPYRPMRT